MKPRPRAQPNGVRYFTPRACVKDKPSLQVARRESAFEFPVRLWYRHGRWRLSLF